ncbi:TPA: hypothetical protein U1049_002116 [Streptococcus suis]|nr:hypothetical protein [Streptococcus suis]HEM4739861.1 hypothetical protein [Streptococcus suis]HEM4754363.1 hypothetical protein [Streptococcus suis]HEM4790150.1 hypothetical protein [Streptococcus suis]HEM4849697.1 hypothetical protein [Streptococcus suis]
MAWNYDTISKTLSDMALENYEDMVKAFLAMELSIKNILRLVVRKSPTGESTYYFFFMLK